MSQKTIYMDVSNLLEQNFLTGIQRVVREVALRLCRHDGLDVKFLRIDTSNHRFECVPEKVFRDVLAGHPLRTKMDFPCLELAQLQRGSIFYDIDAVWGAQPQRSWLYPALRAQGVLVVTFVHDIIPITEPQYCYPNTVCQFMNYTGAVLNHANAIFVSTQATMREIQKLQEKVNSPKVPVYVTGLGADFAASSSQGEVSPAVIQALGQQPYILLVSTLEPRKNHSLLLDAFDMGLYEEGLNLVFAGRFGWGIEELQKRIQNHPQLGRHLLHFSGQNDATIDYLYRHAFLTAYPSFNEGFGLPIIESLVRGVPVVASNRDVLQEVGKDFCLYCDPTKPADWADLFRQMLHSPEKMQELRAHLQAFKAPTWDEATDKMADYLIQSVQ